MGVALPGTPLCVAEPGTRHKASGAQHSWKRIGIPILVTVLILACLAAVGLLGEAPALFCACSCPVLGWEWLYHHHPEPPGPKLSSPLPPSQGLSGAPLLHLQAAPEAGAAGAGLQRGGGLPARRG